jgi:hypothetical protein
MQTHKPRATITWGTALPTEARQMAWNRMWSWLLEDGDEHDQQTAGGNGEAREGRISRAPTTSDADCLDQAAATAPTPPEEKAP